MIKGDIDRFLRRYLELSQSEPGLFGNRQDAPIRILHERSEIAVAQAETRRSREQAGLETSDLRVGVLAEDVYIGRVIRDAVRFADGSLGLYNRVVASGGIVVLPIIDGDIALIRIFRHPPRRWFLEAPQGLLLPGQDPAEQARRELTEEMGATVGTVTPLGVAYTSTALTSENLKMFAAEITAIGAPQRSEGIESIHRIEKKNIDRLVLDGTICDGPTMSLILHARLIKRL